MNTGKIWFLAAAGHGLGLAAGFIAGYLYAKKKFLKALEEKDDSMMQIAKQYEDKKKMFEKYREEVKALDYVPADAPKEEVEMEEEKKMDGVKLSDSIYILHPDAYYYDEEYPHEDLVYYEEDDILVDGLGHPVDVEDTVTEEGLKRIGTFEEDAVYILNKKNNVAYNVVRSVDHYTDIPPEWGYDD